MTVDPELVTRKLLLVAADIDALRPVVERGLDAYRGSVMEQAFVERYLERLIGRMIDINYTSQARSSCASLPRPQRFLDRDWSHRPSRSVEIGEPCARHGDGVPVPAS